MGKLEESYFIGQITRIQRTFTKKDVERWSFLTKDFNEVYEFGTSKIIDYQPIVPGIISEGLLLEAVNHQFKDWPNVIVQKELLYIHPVLIGDRITAEVEIIDIHKSRNWITEKVRCMNNNGIDVIKGQMILKLL